MEHKPENGQAGVEVTPEMVQAGLAELATFDPDSDLGSQLVTQIFLAMIRTSQDNAP